jgi:FlaA1/EpsC-like NDP-sugar epimerase
MAGRYIDGKRIYRPSKIPNLVAERNVQEIILAVENRKASDRSALLKSLEKYGVRVRLLADLESIALGNVNLESLRDVGGKDLLGREEVPPDPHLLSRAIEGKSILITGAGGSIGSELARRSLELKPRRVVLLDSSEAALYEIEKELGSNLIDNRATNRPTLNTVLGSVLDASLIKETLTFYDVDTIFHAAAYKHLPLVEHHPIAGVLNNSLGTEVIARAALENHTERFILISTDKAVRPTSVMGASKRLAELIVQSLSESSDRTIFASVRFGNVLGSSGSVTRRFREQIQAGGPVTVRHPDVVRYFMSIREATNLVIQAAGLAEGGEVFVLDMSTPIRIDDLARSMIKLMGLQVRTPESPDGEIEIKYTGLRPGEKLAEELLISDGMAIATEHPRIMMSREPNVDQALLWRELEVMKMAVKDRNLSLLISSLTKCVEGYIPGIVTESATAKINTH